MTGSLHAGPRQAGEGELAGGAAVDALGEEDAAVGEGVVHDASAISAIEAASARMSGKRTRTYACYVTITWTSKIIAKSGHAWPGVHRGVAVALMVAVPGLAAS